MEQILVRLSEISKLYAGGDAPKEVSNIRTKDFCCPIFSNGFENAGLYGFCKKATMKSDTITISARGTIGAVFYRKEPYLPIVRLITIEPNSKVDSKYIYYYLQMNKIEGYGTSQQQLTIPFMKKRKLLICRDKNYQVRIASILNKYDELIENNNKRIKLLEDTAQSLYKEWFIRFRFPGYENADKDFIFKRNIKLGELITRKKHKLKDWDGMKIIDLANMPQFSININSFGCSSDFDTNIFQLEKNDLLFGSIRPYFGKVGFSSINGGVCGTVYCFTAKNNIAWNYILFLISSELFINYCDKCSNGTKMPVIDYDVMCRYKVFLPNDNLLNDFNKRITPIINFIVKLQEKNRILIEQRNLLLPRLMSGKLSIEGKDII